MIAINGRNMSWRREILGVLVGSAVSCTILAVLILHVLPRDRASIEVVPEGYLPSKGGPASEGQRRA